MHAKRYVAEVKLPELKQNGKPEMTPTKSKGDEVLADFFETVEEWLAASLMKATHIL